LIHELVTKRISPSLFSKSAEKRKEKEEEQTPITLECDEVLLILGPSLKYMTNHDYINDEDTEDDEEESREYIDQDSYDSLHYLRVVESRLKHRLAKQQRQERIERQNAAKETLKLRKAKSEEKEPDPDAIVKGFNMFLKLLNISIKKIHIRYEDDYFVTNEPYAFGLVIGSMKMYSYDKDIKFQTAIDVTYEEFYPKNHDILQLKKFEISDVRLYWNTKSETYIPNSLQEFTRGHRQQIFEAIGEDTLRDLMLHVFDHVENDQKYLYGNARFPAAKFQYLIDSFSIDSHISYYNVKNADVEKLESHRFRMGF